MTTLTLKLQIYQVESPDGKPTVTRQISWMETGVSENPDGTDLTGLEDQTLKTIAEAIREILEGTTDSDDEELSAFHVSGKAAENFTSEDADLILDHLKHRAGDTDESTRIDTPATPDVPQAAD